MSSTRQRIEFCKSSDGTRIAVARMGNGPVLVRAPHFFTHLDYEPTSAVWGPWLAELSRENTLIRYDGRGCGLSDRNCRDFSPEAALADLEAVVAAAGIDRFSLLGCSQGAATCIAYAAAYPERVRRLVFYGAYARGALKRDPTPEQVVETEIQANIIRLGWGRENPAYRQVMTSLFIPDSTPEHVASFNELERVSAHPATAASVFAALNRIDVTAMAGQVNCPALVVHTKGDARVPFDEGRILAGLIPGAIFLPLESRNHIVLGHEPAFRECFARIREFLRAGLDEGVADACGFTSRESEIVELLAHGLDNWQIAARLSLSEKTVRNNACRIFDKLGVHTRALAIVKARQAGFAARPLVED